MSWNLRFPDTPGLSTGVFFSITIILNNEHDKYLYPKSDGTAEVHKNQLKTHSIGVATLRDWVGVAFGN